MPTTYTHYKFGEAVYHTLPEDLKILIDAHRKLYDIGLHGPDILFYFRPYRKNKINTLGGKIHKEVASNFFSNGKKLYQQSNDDAMLVYLLGFINHFILDSECHHYINHYVIKKNVSHSLIEAQWDRLLLLQDGKNPTSFLVTSHLHPSKENAAIIAPLFSLNQKEVYHSLKDMKRYLNLLVCGNFKRKLIKLIIDLLHLNPSYFDLIIQENGDNRCDESNQVLIQKYQDAITIASKQIIAFFQTINQDTLDPRFHQNFE